MNLSQLRATHVRHAIAECNQLGETEFLRVRGFRASRSYLLLYGGRLYQSKAIVGAAYEYATGQRSTADSFSGGAATVQHTLEGLGFTVIRRPFADAPVGPAFDGVGTALRGEMSPWVPLVDRSVLGERLAYVGVYLVAVAMRTPTVSIPPAKCVVYIGETSRTLGTRLREFETVALNKRPSGHSGAVTFRRKKCGLQGNVYLQVVPVRRPNEEQSAMVSLIERYLIWSYTRAHRRMPTCNSK